MDTLWIYVQHLVDEEIKKLDKTLATASNPKGVTDITGTYKSNTIPNNIFL
jgi:hypothetical protein